MIGKAFDRHCITNRQYRVEDWAFYTAQDVLSNNQELSALQHLSFEYTSSTL
jgi:hypothetical protein